MDITKPNGEIPQIGDNDSGRFIKLSPNGKFLTNKEAEEIYLNLKGYNELIKDYDTENGLFWDENILNHQTFVSAVDGLFEDEIFKTDFPLEKSFVEVLAEGRKLKVKDKSYKPVKVSKNLKINLSDLKYKKTIEYKLPFSLDKYPVKTYFYPDSGIYIFKNDRFYLSICATPLGQNGNGGHTHNDKLSYELWIDGKDFERDPGTYVYTPLPYRRNEFRSVKAHNVPQLGIEQNSWIDGRKDLFRMVKIFKWFIKTYSDQVVEACLRYRETIVIRRYKLLKDRIEVVDASNWQLKENNFIYYSSGYGKLRKK